MQKGLPHGRPLLNRCLTVSYSRMANATLPSALPRFTSEFGMGSGGSTALWPPGKFFNLRKLILLFVLGICYKP